MCQVGNGIAREIRISNRGAVSARGQPINHESVISVDRLSAVSTTLPASTAAAARLPRSTDSKPAGRTLLQRSTDGTDRRTPYVA